MRALTVRRAAAASTLLSLLWAGSIAPASGNVATRVTSSPLAHTAASLSAKEEGRLKLVKASGSVLIDEGPVLGTIPGKVRVRFTYTGNPSVSAQVTIFGHAGTILAHGSARLSSPTSPTPSFKGALSITGGTGRYANARGQGELF